MIIRKNKINRIII